MLRLEKGAYTSLGRPEDGVKNVPRLLGEACWTLLNDNAWEGHPHRVTKLVRLPAGGDEFLGGRP